MIKTRLALLAGALLPAIVFAQEKPCRPSKHAKIPAITESTYNKARKRLLAAGWQPVKTKPANEARTDPDISHEMACSSGARDMWRSKRAREQVWLRVRFFSKTSTEIVSASPLKERKFRAGNLTRE